MMASASDNIRNDTELLIEHGKLLQEQRSLDIQGRAIARRRAQIRERLLQVEGAISGREQMREQMKQSAQEEAEK